MALVTHNTKLEYATNTLEFWLLDSDGVAVDFSTPLTFNVERIDNEDINHSVGAAEVSGNYAKFVVTPPLSLQKSSDSIYDYVNSKYEHIYSIKSAEQVYIVGKLSIVKAA